MAGQQGADRLAAAHGIPGFQSRLHGLVAGDDAAGMPDRQHRTTHDDPRERHDTVGGREHPGARRADVDAAMAGTVWRRGGEVLAHDGVRRVDGPAPAPGGSGADRNRGGGGDRNAGDTAAGSGHGEHYEQAEYCEGEAVRHPLTFVARVLSAAWRDRSVRKAPPGAPAGERCYHFRSTWSNPGDYACPQCSHMHWPPLPTSRCVGVIYRVSAGVCQGTRFHTDRSWKKTE